MSGSISVALVLTGKTNRNMNLPMVKKVREKYASVSTPIEIFRKMFQVFTKMRP